MSAWGRLAQFATSLLREVIHSSERSRTTTSSGPGSTTHPGSRGGSTEVRTDDRVPGSATTVTEYDGPLPVLEYAPERDDDADPGEVVWAWVPYEEDNGQGKDRPVLIIARRGAGYIGLQMTSKDRDRDRAAEARRGRYWYDIGSGGWDSRGRDSEVRLDRLLHLPARAVRREGAALDRSRYDDVARALVALHGS